MRRAHGVRDVGLAGSRSTSSRAAANHRCEDSTVRADWGVRCHARPSAPRNLCNPRPPPRTITPVADEPGDASCRLLQRRSAMWSTSCARIRRSTRSSRPTWSASPRRPRSSSSSPARRSSRRAPQPVEHLRVVRTGAVEIVLAGRVLDLLGPGELFGHASMLSGLPPGFAARAQEDTLCYRIPEPVARAVLARPESVGFVARSLLDDARDARRRRSAPRRPAPDPANQPVAALIRDPPVLCSPDDDDPRGGREDDRRRRDVDRDRPRRLARHPHRPRSALARGRRRRPLRRARVVGDERARLHRRAGPARRRRAARDARPRRPPLPGRRPRAAR